MREHSDKLLFGRLNKCCHCEERSDVAIPLVFRKPRKTGELSTEAP